MSTIESEGKRVIYEVNLFIDADTLEDYKAWLLPHMQEMLTLPGFISAQLAQTELVSETPGELIYSFYYNIANTLYKHIYVP